MKQQLEQLQQEFSAQADGVETLEDAKTLHTEYLGRKGGKLNEVLRGLKDLSIEEKKEIGPFANQLKAQMENRLNAIENALRSSERSQADLTLPGIAPAAGTLHPLTLIRNDLEDVFRSMGFMVFEGPELDNDFYVFEGLNFPPDHPARDMQDTFFVDNEMDRPEEKRELDPTKWLARTHTSNMQVRIMEQFEPPFRAAVLGQCFRNEATDATHEHTFNQLELFAVGEDITIGHLKWTLQELFHNIIGPEAKIRLRPGYFPFVEPAYEVDAYMPGVKKGTDWVEMLGSGMIHQNVLKAAGYDERKYTGFALGMGYDRLAMLRYGITDIRDFRTNDIRFLKQF